MNLIFVILVSVVVISVKNCQISMKLNSTVSIKPLRNQGGFMWAKRPKEKTSGQKWLYQQQANFDSSVEGYIHPRCMEAINRSIIKQFPLWGYDKGLKRCIRYDYRQCGDSFSGNRFDSQEDCEDTCRYYDYDD